MKHFFLFLIVSFSASVSAECYEFTPIKAQYSVTVEGKPSTQFSIVRFNEHSVYYDYSSEGVGRYWHRLKNKRIATTHFFHEFKRSIEYEPSDLINARSFSWSKQYYLLSEVTKSKIDAMADTKSCEKIYDNKKGDTNLHVVWSDRHQLPKDIEYTSNGVVTHIRLLGISSNEQEITNLWSMLNGYQSTDYADVGDNEADPFLRKMIRLGFVKHGASGFYDSEGHAMGHDADHSH